MANLSNQISEKEYVQINVSSFEEISQEEVTSTAT